ncbi:MAG TPA: hypothetical protein VG734_04635 [Lacunisphaera sp.]|nr:hypothetical protein [Lacunisphaera sp.]
MTTPRARLIGAALIGSAALFVGASQPASDHPDLGPGGEWIALSADAGVVLDATAQQSVGRHQDQLMGVLYVRRDGNWRRVMLINQPAALKVGR